MDVSLKDNILGEVYFLCVLNYFVLVNYFRNILLVIKFVVNLVEI